MDGDAVVAQGHSTKIGSPGRDCNSPRAGTPAFNAKNRAAAGISSGGTGLATEIAG